MQFMVKLFHQHAIFASLDNMNFQFYKYQGTGNDFVVLDDRKAEFPIHNSAFIQRLCDRKFGIGADGFILLRNKEGYDFEMVYFNSDGKQSSMCGNGGRCIVHFANFLGVIEQSCSFLAIDGPHLAKVTEDEVSLQMVDVQETEAIGQDLFIDTGSPHYLVFENNIAEAPLVEKARAIRYNERFSAAGTNVNLVETTEKGIKVRTYERGVEDETLSCGTGVTAAALGVAITQNRPSPISVETPGGRLRISFEQGANGFTNIWLTGPATQVFTGSISSTE